MPKAIIWGFTLIGLAPAVLTLLGAAYAFWAVTHSPATRWYGSSPVHDAYYSLFVGPMTVEVFPRVWVLGLMAAGIVALIVGLVFLLHIPSAGQIIHQH